MMNRLSIPIAFGVCLITANLATASPIVTYQFPTGTAAPTTVAANVSAGNMINGGNLSTFDPNFDGAFGSAPVLRVTPGNPTSQNGNTAFSNSNFFSFTVTPDAGFALDLTSLSFDAARGGNTGLPRNIAVRSSLTGNTNLLDTTAVPTLRPNFTGFLVDLSSFGALQNVKGPVTFQIAVATDNTGRSIEFDNFALNGVVTPEPASIVVWTIAGFLGSSCVWWRRFFQRR